MTGIIDHRANDAEKVAKSFASLISKKGLQAIRRRAVNKIGSGLRKDAKALAPEIFGTSAAALSIQGKAAGAGRHRPLLSS